MRQQRRGHMRTAKIGTAGLLLRFRIGIGLYEYLSDVRPGRLTDELGSNQIHPDILQRTAICRDLLLLRKINGFDLLFQIRGELLQGALRLARVRRHLDRLLLVGSGLLRSLLRDSVPGLVEHAGLPVAEEIGLFLAALPEACPILIKDDLNLLRDDPVLLLNGGGEPFHCGLQGRDLLHEHVHDRLRNHLLRHAAHRLPARFLHL